MKRMVASAAVVAVALCACNNDSSSADESQGESSSAQEESLPGSSGAMSPDEPSSAERSSSASEGSSTSGTSLSGSDVSPQAAADYKFECSSNKESKTSDLAVNSLDLGGSEPQAWKYVKDGSVHVEVGDIMMQCAISIKSMDVSLSGDTLYADYEVDLSAPQANCICPTKVSFTVGAEYETAKYVTISKATYPLRGATYGEEPSSELKKAGFLRGECQKDGLSLSKSTTEGATASEGLPEATLSCHGGSCFVEVNNVMDYCEVTASVSQKRSNDTLYVDYYNMGAVSKCICNFDYHKFTVDTENSDAKYFSFKGEVFRMVAILN